MVSARGSRGSMSGAMLSSHLSGWFRHSPEVQSHYCLDLKKAILYIGLVDNFSADRKESETQHVCAPGTAWEATMIAHSMKGKKLSHGEVNKGAHRHKGASSGCKRELKQQLPRRI